MAYGTEERMWTLEEYIEKYEQLQAESKRYRTALQEIVIHEEARKKVSIGYDLYVHDTAVEALVF